MRRLIALATVAGMTSLGLVAVTGPAEAKVPGPNGQIAFGREDPTVCVFVGQHAGFCASSYTVNPDGSHLQLLSPGGSPPRWSPDGTEVAVLPDCSFGGDCGAAIVNPDTGSSRQVPNPEPTVFNGFFGCIVWSPDGTRLACDAVGDAPGVIGIYTIRSSDGGGLTQVLACPTECVPIDYSPDGKRLLISRSDPSGQPELFVVKLNGTGLHRITPSGMAVDVHDGAASWSPSGNHILFGAHADTAHRRSIFVVNSDGTGLHQVAIPGCGGVSSDGGSIGCFDPSWSPDGTKIVFVRASASANVQNVYTANEDGSGLSQVTNNSSGLGVGNPDWGPHPLAT